jgi:hypothetical protein
MSIGAFSGTGHARCNGSGDRSCGNGGGFCVEGLVCVASSFGMGAVSLTGDAECTTQCGTIGGSSGLGALSVAGHARCERKFDVHHAGGASEAQCAGGRDVAEQLSVT